MYTVNEYLDKEYGIGSVPKYMAARCTGRKSFGNECDICARVCPEKIYPKGKRMHPVWDGCIRCGLCSAACPARCLTAPKDQVKRFLMALQKRTRCTIGCGKCKDLPALRVSCIAALSWEQLAIAALRGGVVLQLGFCRECERIDAYRQIEETRKKLKSFLGEAYDRENVTEVHDPEEAFPEEKKIVNRREFFQVMKSFPIDKALAMMPKLENKQESGLFYRAILRNMVKQPVVMELPLFSENCYQCGYCEKACPNQALEFIAEEGHFTAVVDIWKCTGCGICKNICRNQGIKSIVPMKVPHLGKAALAKMAKSVCPGCGKAVSRDHKGLCGVCEKKAKVEESKARYEKRKNVRSEHRDYVLSDSSFASRSAAARQHQLDNGDFSSLSAGDSSRFGYEEKVYDAKERY